MACGAGGKEYRRRDSRRRGGGNRQGKPGDHPGEIPSVVRRLPGELGTSLLRARVAYAVQEARTGLHLTASETAALVYIAKSDPIINPGIRPVAKAKTYRAGKTWTRVYRGVRHAIRADGRGRFIYDGDGETYASPTAIARRITGTHISGRAFFGIND